MTDRDNITLPREVVVAAIAALDSVEWLSSRVIRKRGDETIAALRAHLAAPKQESSGLRKAAEAVLERWDSPAWEWSKQGPTADLMADLRAHLAAPPEDIEALRRENERLRANAERGTAALREAFGPELWALGHPAYIIAHLREEIAKFDRLWKAATVERDALLADAARWKWVKGVIGAEDAAIDAAMENKR